MSTEYTVGSLFTGIAGLDRGLEMLGLGPVVWQAESDPYCRAVLQQHYPATKRYERVEDIDEHAEKVGIICGGFPCQDLSIAGARAGIDGPRSGLWSDFVRIVRVLRPGIVFVENVPELAAYLGRVLGPLAELGFDAEWDLFSAAEVGAPHLRERMFVLAFLPDALRGGLRYEVQPLNEPWSIAATVTGDDGSASSLADADGPAGPRTRRGQPAAHSSGWWDAEPHVGRVVDGPASRLDARRRRARLRCLGNAVVPRQAALAFMTLAARAGVLFDRSE